MRDRYEATYHDYEEWASEAKARKLLLVGCSNGIVAQTGPQGTCRGFWGFNTLKGWIER